MKSQIFDTNWWNIFTPIKFIIKIVAIIILIIFLLPLFFGLFGTVWAWERWVLLRFWAVQDKIFDEWLYFKIPYIDSVVIIDTKIQKEQTVSDSASKDLQIVNTVVALNFHIKPEKVAYIYQNVWVNFKERIIDPAIQESIKASTAKFTADQLITSREAVREEIKKLLKTKLEPLWIIVNDINIVNFNFSTSFNKAIEEKVTAEQEALAAKNKLERIKFEADQRIAEAKWKAEAMRVESEALKSNPEVLQLRALEKWNWILPQVTSWTIPFINVWNFWK